MTRWTYSWNRVRLLAEISLRNLLASKLKTIIVGAIILYGAMATALGGTLLESVDSGMRRSIQGTLAGHLQIYSSKSPEDLALFGGMFGDPKLEPIEDFSRVKSAIAGIPNVKLVVPLGIGQANLTLTNPFDLAVSHLRDDVREGITVSESNAERWRTRKEHVRRLVRILQQDLERSASILTSSEMEAEQRRRDWGDLERAASDSFWKAFDDKPLDALEFLENRVAPQFPEERSTVVRYVGTDLDAFQSGFPNAKIIEGTSVPPGKRGIVLGKLYAEDWLKLKTARRLDKIHEARALEHRHIDDDPALQRLVQENVSQTRELLFQFDALAMRSAVERLRKALASNETDLQKLLVQLLRTNDENFDAHYRIFYSELAPLLELYSFRVGDTITLRAPSQSGYLKSVRVKVYGLLQFAGLERFSLIGSLSLVDLRTFRELFGAMSPEQAREVSELRAMAGAHDVSKEQAEAELFRGTTPLVSESSASAPIEDARLLAELTARQDDSVESTRDQEQIDRGIAMNAAVLLRNVELLTATQREIESVAKREKLDLRVVTWRQAAGMVGHFITIARINLLTGITILFTVILIIVSNATIMATLQRVKDIGTLRAIGASRRFVFLMLLAETLILGTISAILGAALAAALVLIVRAFGGIPVTQEALQFFFCGPRLLPMITPASLGLSLLVVLFVSALSALYPAVVASRVAPAHAMEKDE